MARKIVIVLAIIFIFGIFTLAGNVSASPSFVSTPQPTPTRRIALAAELQKAKVEWAQTAHAETFDAGQGANTTCARCKSPMNWDPQAPAAEQALDCGACKRVPGAPRPDLEGGVPIAQNEWKNIGCAVCHEPVGNSYYPAVAFWNQELGRYEPIENANELCAKCHEGQHGFEVMAEQTASPAHKGWTCTRCHGAHGTPSACASCHNPATGSGAAEHARHPNVNCTACHDAGGLSIWYNATLGTRHYQEYVPIRFAHALESWTSHNIQKQVWCGRCHHPRPDNSAPVASEVGCQECHADGFVMFWCRFFPRDESPFVAPIPGY